MLDLSSRPNRLHGPIDATTFEAIITLRRQRLCEKHISLQAALFPATVSMLTKIIRFRLSHLYQAQPVLRYVREHPGELIHVGITLLERFYRVGHCTSGNRNDQSNRCKVGWEYVHVSLGYASRVSFTDLFPGENATRGSDFFAAGVAYYNGRWVTVNRVMTDKGPCKKPSPSAMPASASACALIAIDQSPRGTIGKLNASSKSCSRN